jgi:autotransporter-associated beta strand protein
MSTKRHNYIHFTLAAFLAAMPFAAKATVFFSDTFGSGSTLTNVTPANPTANSTAYQYLTGGRSFPAWLNLAANDLRIGTTSGSSVIGECQTLFSTNPIILAADGDYIQVTVTFTNFGQLFSGSASLGLGLFNSGGLNGSVKPVPGGLNASLTLNSNTAPTGYAQNWKGYFGFIVTNGTAHKIYNRAAQTGAANNNQATVTTGTSSSPQNPNPAALSNIGISASPSLLSLTMGATYTEVLAITRNGANSVAITNTLYSGPNTGGSVIVSCGAIATNATYLTSAFDALSFGYRATTGITNDISSIKVDGSVTVAAVPPTITLQPASVTVASGGSCPFFVTATGNNVVYQWCRNGTNLLNSGNISGATSSLLVITNASAADVASGANGYYCVVSEFGGPSTNTITNSLALVAARNLIWNGADANWDLTNSPNWNSSGNPTTFNYGDAVTFDDTGSASPAVILNSPFLSASKWRVTGNTLYTFNGPGYFAGNGALIFNSSVASGNMQLLNVTNTHTGGTIVSNDNAALSIYCTKYQNLGNGPLTLAKPGVMEFAVSGNASLGIPGDVSVNDDFTIQFDGSGVFAGVFLGNISGSSGKTLTLLPQTIANVNRYRLYGTNTVCNANIALNPSGNSTTNALYDGTTLAPYGASGTQTYNGVISGFGGIINKNGGGASTILSGNNTYSGGTTIAQGTLGLGNDNALGAGQLNLGGDGSSTASATGTIFASGGAHTIANALHYTTGTNNYSFIISGTNNITFTSDLDLNGLDNTGNPGARTITVNNTGATTLSGIVSDSSANNLGFVKAGTGVLYLNGASTFAGYTTNSAGRLAGNGSLAGSVVVQTNAFIGGGASSAIGTLAIGGSLTFASGGGGYFRLNKSNGQTSDQLAVTGLITNFSTGTNIVVTNIGPALVASDTFTLFNKAVTNGSALKVTGGLAAGLSWTNKLGINGTIQVVQGFATYSTNITFTVNNSTLTISWPATHQGWSLQAQTNSLSAGLGTNWVTIPGTDVVTSTNLSIVPGNPSVFYRLKMP